MKAITALMFAGVSMLALAVSAQANTTVGAGPASVCFQATQNNVEQHVDAAKHAGIQNCSAALDGALSEKERTATLVNRGILESALGDYAAAKADYNAAIARDSQFTAAYVNRGVALMHTAQFDEAVADFDRAIAMGAQNPQVIYFNKAVAEESAGNTASAYRDYQHSASLAPGFKPARDELARFKVMDNRYAQAQ